MCIDDTKIIFLFAVMWEKVLEAHPSIAVINRNTFRPDNAFKGPVDGILNMSEKNVL